MLNFDASSRTRQRAVTESRRRQHHRSIVATALVVAALATAAGVVLAVRHDGASKAATAAHPRAVARTATTVFVPPVRTSTDAAEEFYFSWQRGDRVGATRVANYQAITGLFGVKTTLAAGLAFGGCSKPRNGTSTCTWTRHNASLTMRVVIPGRGSPKVQSAELR